jgi:hypothetical protein
MQNNDDQELEALLAAAENERENTSPIRHYPAAVPAKQSLYRLTNDFYDLSDYFPKPGIKRGRERYRQQFLDGAAGTKTIAQLTRTILGLTQHRMMEENLRDNPLPEPSWLVHNPAQLRRIIREITTLGIELKLRLARADEALEAEVQTQMQALETELFEALLPPPTTPPVERLTDTVVIAPGAPARN